MTDFPFAYSLAHAECGWAWRIFDEDGETVAQLAALGVLVVMLSLAALVDGLSTRRRRVAGRRAGEAASAPSDDTTSDAADDDVPETHDDTVPSALDGTSVRSERGSG